MNTSDINTIPFRYTINHPYITHAQRIVNSHRGYLDNFVECLFEIYDNDIKNDTEFRDAFLGLIKKINKIRDEYKANITKMPVLD